MSLWPAAWRRSNRRPARPAARPSVEALESRLTPYVATGNAWAHPELITLSFVPDGTVLAVGNGGNITSNLFSAFNARFNNNTAGWENVILKAAQSWAAQTNINFAVVADDGSDAGSGQYQQGASNFGDIRIGAYNFGSGCNWLASTFYPPSANNYSVAGDVAFNLDYPFNVGSTYDLYTVAAHEIGHALGLALSNAASAVMYATYNNSHTGLASDDVSGIRATFSNGNARSPDAFDASGGNNTFATASNITTTISTGSLTAVLNNLDITSAVNSSNAVTTADVDYYQFTAPAGSARTMTVQVQSSGLSLLSPTVTVYAANQTTVLGSANGKGQDGTTLTVSNIAVTPGATYYVKVQGADTTVFSTGKYALELNLGTGATPTAAPPNTRTANGDVPTSGGGVPMEPAKYPSKNVAHFDIDVSLGPVTLSVGGSTGSSLLTGSPQGTNAGLSLSLSGSVAPVTVVPGVSTPTTSVGNFTDLQADTSTPASAGAPLSPTATDLLFATVAPQPSGSTSAAGTDLLPPLALAPAISV